MYWIKFHTYFTFKVIKDSVPCTMKLLFLLFGLIQTNLQPQWVHRCSLAAFVISPKFNTRVLNGGVYLQVPFWCTFFKKCWEIKEGGLHLTPFTFSVIDFAERTSYRALYTWIKDVRHHLFLFKLEFPEAFIPVFLPVWNAEAPGVQNETFVTHRFSLASTFNNSE